MALDLSENYVLKREGVKIATHINALRKAMVSEPQKALEYSRGPFSVENVQGPSTKPEEVNQNATTAPHNEICN